MNRNILSFSILLIVLSACTSSVTPPAEKPTSVAAAPASPDTPLPSPSPSETAAATPTPSQPVYDPTQVGDLGKLKSYVITRRDNERSGTLSTTGGDSSSRGWTLTVVNDPSQVKFTQVSTRSATADRPEENRTSDLYLLGGNSYQYDQQAKFWTIKPKGEIDKFYFDPSAELNSFKTARFVGQEEIQGIQANHFAFDTADYQKPAQYPGTIDSAKGNIFLSLEGNYLLHMDGIMTGNVWETNVAGSTETKYLPGVYEWSYELSSLNQMTEIALPADLPKQVSLETGVPLPPDAILSDIMVFQNTPPYSYEYETGLNLDEVLSYYQAFKPVDGWEVTMAVKSPSGISRLIRLKKEGEKAVLLTAQVNQITQKDMLSYQYPPQ